MTPNEPLHDLAALWAQVEAPAPHTDDLAEADATTQHTVAWMRAALDASVPQTPPPLATPHAPRWPWRAGMAAAALAAAALMPRAIDRESTPDPPTALLTESAAPEPRALPQGLAANPNFDALELRSGPVRLTYITHAKP